MLETLLLHNVNAIVRNRGNFFSEARLTQFLDRKIHLMRELASTGGCRIISIQNTIVLSIEYTTKQKLGLNYCKATSMSGGISVSYCIKQDDKEERFFKTFDATEEEESRMGLPMDVTPQKVSLDRNLNTLLQRSFSN